MSDTEATANEWVNGAFQQEGKWWSQSDGINYNKVFFLVCFLLLSGGHVSQFVSSQTRLHIQTAACSQREILTGWMLHSCFMRQKCICAVILPHAHHPVAGISVSWVRFCKNHGYVQTERFFFVATLHLLRLNFSRVTALCLSFCLFGGRKKKHFGHHKSVEKCLQVSLK